ncbi:MAG TPA: methylisocitrate lyase, partial [Actinoplanes sp.]|nr:methylisocitrate lyase [Actinoplanes sp.]
RELDRVHAALADVPLVLSRSEAAPGRGRLGDAQLVALGVRMVLHPLAAVLAALRAVSRAYRAIADDGAATRVDRLPLAVLGTLGEQSDVPPEPGMDNIDT